MPLLADGTSTCVSQSQCASVARTLLCDVYADCRRLEKTTTVFSSKPTASKNELSPEVPTDQITLYRPDREEDIKRLISYAIGCMMGRYSLDKPGLIYAHSGNKGFDPSQYKTFPPTKTASFRLPTSTGSRTTRPTASRSSSARRGRRNTWKRT